MHAPRRSDASRRPARGQLSLVPEDGTHAYGPHPRRGDGRLDFAEARRIVEHERSGTAARANAPERIDGDLRSSNSVETASATEPVELDDTDRMLARLLGAVRIA